MGTFHAELEPGTKQETFLANQVQLKDNKPDKTQTWHNSKFKNRILIVPMVT